MKSASNISIPSKPGHQQLRVSFSLRLPEIETVAMEVFIDALTPDSQNKRGSHSTMSGTRIIAHRASSSTARKAQISPNDLFQRDAGDPR